MKTTFSVFILLFSLSISYGQILGNYKRGSNDFVRQRQSNEPFAGNQFRSVAKAASIIGENNLQISINALSNQQASSYLAVFNLTQLGTTAENTNDTLNKRISTFIASLKNIGIQQEDLYVDMVNFVPKYEIDVSKKLFSKKTFKEIPIGFELQKNVHIRFSDPQMLDKIVTEAAKEEIYDIVKVDYFLEDPKAVYNELRVSAFNYLNEIKEQYQNIGMELDSAYMITGENAWVAFPGDRYVSYKAYSNQVNAPQKKFDAKVDKIDKPISRFYDPIQPNDYDIVLNPEILEPAIQFSYNLVVKFTMPPMVPKKEIVREKAFILVTPEGQVKTLKIEEN